MITATPRFHRPFIAQTNAWFLKSSGDKALLAGFTILCVGEKEERETAFLHFENSEIPIHPMEKVHSANRTRSCHISMQAECSVAVGIVTIIHDGLHPGLSL